MIDTKTSIKPNFLIVGAAKSGTTSLYHYLKEHPDVFMPDWKEPSFFAPPEAGGVATEEGYLALFKSAEGSKAIGEASVAYLYSEDVPQKIQDFLGLETKIIVLLRNPVDMAYSLWGHQVQEGAEELSFEEALNQEEARLQKHKDSKLHDSWIYNYAYTQRAQYKPQIERYDALFGAENIKIYLFEDFFTEGLPFFADLCTFLGIDSSFNPEEKIHNRGGKLRSTTLQKFLNESNSFKSFLKKLLPQRLRSAIKHGLTVLNRKPGERSPMSGNVQDNLQKLFDGDVRWLEKRMNRNLKKEWF